MPITIDIQAVLQRVLDLAGARLQHGQDGVRYTVNKEALEEAFEVTLSPLCGEAAGALDAVRRIHEAGFGVDGQSLHSLLDILLGEVLLGDDITQQHLESKELMATEAPYFAAICPELGDLRALDNTYDQKMCIPCGRSAPQGSEGQDAGPQVPAPPKLGCSDAPALPNGDYHGWPEFAGQ